MVEVLKDINSGVEQAINKCLSSSQVCGYELREAHYYLGRKLGKEIANARSIFNKKVAVLIMMRAGLPFGFGIADALDESNDVAVLFSTSDNDYSSFDIVVIGDAVVNTGKTILEIRSKLTDKQVIIATNVISDKYLDNLKELDIFATRISEHSYKGVKTTTVSNGKGPDTGDRLFDNSFYK